MNLDKLLNICILSVSGLPEGMCAPTVRILSSVPLLIGLLRDNLNNCPMLFHPRLIYLIPKQESNPNIRKTD